MRSPWNCSPYGLDNTVHKISDWRLHPRAQQNVLYNTPWARSLPHLLLQVNCNKHKRCEYSVWESLYDITFHYDILCEQISLIKHILLQFMANGRALCRILPSLLWLCDPLLLCRKLIAKDFNFVQQRYLIFCFIIEDINKEENHLPNGVDLFYNRIEVFLICWRENWDFWIATGNIFLIRYFYAKIISL